MELSKRISQQQQQQQLTPQPVKPALALPVFERIPTSTWGPFTIIVVVFLVILTCFILNCSRIRRKVNERRMDKLGLSGTFKQKSYEKRHKELQEADLEWNNNPPMVYEDKLSTPESAHYSKHSSVSSSAWSSHSTLEIAQDHHYNDINFIKNQPPGVQLRLALESPSTSSLHGEPMLVALSSKSSKSSRNSSMLSSKSSLPPSPPIVALPSKITASIHQA